jgi:Fatty acid desaturase
MVIRSQWLQASGYLFIFLMPVLFLVGALHGRTWLAFGVVLMIFPLARLVFGALPPCGVPEWREGVATALDKLPLAYVPVLAASVLVGLHATATLGGADAVDWLGFGLSLWMTLLFATCVAHELFHRRSKTEARLGHLLAGFCGYPLLGIEHIAHHGRPGDTGRAEVPLMTESMWAFAGRRLWRVGKEFLGRQSPLLQRGSRWPGAGPARAACLATLVTAMVFLALGGWQGLLVHFGMIVGVTFCIQLITYIQHWGLGDADIASQVDFGRGWEEDCQFQAWITLSISGGVRNSVCEAVY